MQEFKYALLERPEAFDPVDASSERANHVSWPISETLFDVKGTLQNPVVQKSRLVIAVNPDPPTGYTIALTLSPVPVQVFAEDENRGLLPLLSSTVDAAYIAKILRRYQTPGRHRGKLFKLLVNDFHVHNQQTLILELKNQSHGYKSLNYFEQLPLVDTYTGSSVPRGTGPFKYSQLGSPVFLERHLGYDWSSCPGNIDKVSFTFYNTPQGISDALQRGDAHFTPALELPTLPSNVERIEVEALNLFYLGLDFKYPPFKDQPLIRRAVTHAVDVSEVVKIARRYGLNASAAQGPLPPPIRDEQVTQLTYDTQKAMNLLKIAGYNSNTIVPLYCHGDLDSEVAGCIAGYLQQVGIRVDLLPLPTWDDLLAKVTTHHGHLFLYSWHVRWPFHERFLFPLFHSKLSEVTNLTRYDDGDFDTHLERALGLDGQAQLNEYSYLQQKIVDDVPIVCLYHTKRMAAYRRDLVSGLALNPGALPANKLVDVSVT